jgi:hypothetical protein
MKKLLASIAFVLFVLGCAAMPVKKELTAKYFRTVATKTHYLTEQFYPDEDVYWVATEKTNGDDIEISVAWFDYVNTVIGVAFDDINTADPYDYCGLMFFANDKDMMSFINEFDTQTIVNGINVPCGHFLQVLGEQVQEKPEARRDVANDKI